MAVLLQTSLGDVVVDLYADDPCAPVVSSFVKLCAHKYYHGNLLYQVQPNCLAQTGDPTATGKGGAAASALADASKRFVTWGPARGQARRPHDRAGLLSVASMGKVPGGEGDRHAYGSQFFFTLRGEDMEHLDAGGHCVVGEVAEGEDVLRKMGALYLDSDGRPWEDVRVTHAHVLEDPFPDAPGYPEAPPSPTREIPSSERVTARVAYGLAAKQKDDGLTDAERAAREAEKKARSQAEVLEMIGDLPHADVEVPKNELFIAKLNKATEDADLEIIFSRFGRIESCDIVRDWKTGDSLNFAFIAFEEESSCVEAYKKMNNVLIDDSRIRVDFSQSVAKIWSRYTMQYKGSAAAKLREKHRGGGKPADPGHYGPGDPFAAPSRDPYGGAKPRRPDYREPLPSSRSGHSEPYGGARGRVADYRGRVEGRDDRRDRDRSRRERSRSRERSRRDRR